MKKINKRTLIIVIIVVILALGGGVFVAVFNTRGEHIAPNPAGTIGNTPGNINNGGLFCESDGKVYFANSFDNYTLYRMNSDETEIERLSGAVISNILAAGDYIYYFQKSASGETGLGGVRVPFSFNRSRKDGKKAVSLARTVVTTGQLVDNTLYLQGMDDNGAYFFKTGTDGSDYEELARYVLNPASALNGQIYYNSTVGNHFLNRYDTASGAVTTLLEENVWNPVIYGDYVYYMDPGNDYQLRRYSLSNDNIEILTKERVQLFNVGNGLIYFQTFGSSSGLYFMGTDGNGVTLVANGEYTDINMTSQYVYFRDFFDDTVTYHSYPGSTSYTAFAAANPGTAQ
ncbi:MAG: DUF5050 domain-containing protein [Lachnospiraceae bacterium]|nr:DUF5050 domain-containing protein [Lachnospiraceae bacterium]